MDVGNSRFMLFFRIFNTRASTFYFMYIKTAFNALILFKGTEFVYTEIFNEVRESVINVSDLAKFIEMDNDLQDSEIEVCIKKVPHKAHYVIIRAKDGRLTTYVSFYGEKPGKFTLTDKYQGEDFVDDLICNWRDREEFRLENLLS